MWSGPLGGLLKLILPMFFALSGFLVAGSMERCKTAISFAGLRIIRIYPALTVEVLISAFLIGPFVTNLNISAYFRDPMFFHYLVNVTGHISYLLPGVFTDNPLPNIVNWQLWTVKWELACYASLIFLILLGIKTRRWLGIVGLAAFALLCIFDDLNDKNYFLSAVNSHVGGKVLVLSFLCGVIFYQYKEKLPYYPAVAVVSGVTAYVLHSYVPAGDYIAIIPSTYLTTIIGVTDFRRSLVTKLADSSYGIFLYGFSIQQLVAHIIGGVHPWWLNLLVSLPISVAVGLLSWKFIEQPIMKRRNIAFVVEEKLLLISQRWRMGRDL